VTYGIGLEDQGIKATMVAEFNQGSGTTTELAKLKNTSEPLMAGLPASKYLVYGGAVFEPQVGTDFITKFIDPLVAEMNKIGGEPATAVQKYVAAAKKYVAACKGQSFGWIAPGGQLGQSPLVQFVSVQRGDAAALKAAQQDMMVTQQQLTQTLTGNKEQVKVTQTPNAKTVAGVTFDQVVTQFNPAEQGPGAAQAQMMMNTMYGPNGMTMLSGVVGDKLLIASGVSDDVLAQAVAAAKANQNNLDKVAGLQTVANQLPKNRMVAYYVPLDQVVNTVATYAAAFGMPVQIQLPPDLPPIGGTIATEGNAVRLDSYTPTELVRAVVAAGMQVYGQMQGGRQPGGPGGL
jgi:hypothetical protein